MKQYIENQLSLDELQEFERLILERLEKAHRELSFLQEALSKKNDNSIEPSIKLLEEVPDTIEKENLSILVDRQRKYIVHLENALLRIQDGSYGVCIVTGKIIDKERLKIVPHTRHSLEAKQAKESQHK